MGDANHVRSAVALAEGAWPGRARHPRSRSPAPAPCGRVAPALRGDTILRQPGVRMNRFDDILLLVGQVRSAGSAWTAEGGGLLGQGDRTALASAAHVAAREGAKLRVVAVVKPAPGDLRRLLRRSPANVQKMIVAAARAELAEAIAPLRRQGLPISCTVRVGRPVFEVIQCVYEGKHDLVMLPDEGAGSRHHRLGNTALHLLRECPAPVWVMKDAKARARRILAAVDPDPDDPVRDSLNTRILDLAANLSQKEGADLYVAHAWSLFGENLLRSQVDGEADVDELVRHARALHKERIEALVSSVNLQGARPHLHLLKGDAGRLLPKLVAKRDIDLVVMGTVCRTGLPGFVMGNTAETIVRDVDCSVLTIKPQGFVSPVAPASR